MRRPHGLHQRHPKDGGENHGDHAVGDGGGKAGHHACPALDGFRKPALDHSVVKIDLNGIVYHISDSRAGRRRQLCAVLLLRGLQLPGLDDGSDSMETSLKMLRMADEDGISQIILTPHNKPWHRNIDYTRMNAEIGQLQKRLCQEELAIKLYTGSELYYRNGLMEELDQGQAETLANSQYVLVEFDPMSDYD